MKTQGTEGRGRGRILLENNQALVHFGKNYQESCPLLPLAAEGTDWHRHFQALGLRPGRLKNADLHIDLVGWKALNSQGFREIGSGIV